MKRPLMERGLSIAIRFFGSLPLGSTSTRQIIRSELFVWRKISKSQGWSD